MAIQPNQEQVPYLQTDADKLASVAPNAAPAPVVATPAVAIAGVDNSEMITAYALQAAITNALSTLGENSTAGTYLNSIGSTIPDLTVVGQNPSGNLQLIDISQDSQVSSILGITMSPILDTASGTVVFTGLIQTVTTSFSVGTLLYLNVDGTLTSTVPDANTSPFSAGDAVVLIGKITKNATNPSNKDFLIDIQVLGVL